MNANAIVRQARWEQKMFWRNPAAATFTFAFPLMFLVIFIAINGNDRVSLTGRPFFYYSYGVAAAEVAVDTLTGEMRLLRTDILHDVGTSLNPALDIGQIEGGFLQGMGWLTTEELVFHKDGRLLTHHMVTYARADA